MGGSGDGLRDSDCWGLKTNRRHDNGVVFGKSDIQPQILHRAIVKLEVEPSEIGRRLHEGSESGGKGGAAVELVIKQLNGNSLGVPLSAKTVLIEGYWVAGSTTPAVAPAATADS